MRKQKYAEGNKTLEITSTVLAMRMGWMGAGGFSSGAAAVLSAAIDATTFLLLLLPVGKIGRGDGDSASVPSSLDESGGSWRPFLLGVSDSSSHLNWMAADELPVSIFFLKKIRHPCSRQVLRKDYFS
jgi:hypothetical protein